MDVIIVLQAAILGLVEGVTEFLPVSSTGHLILLIDLLDFRGPPGKVFEIVIQLGAILAICCVYRRKLAGTAAGLFTDRQARRFARNVLFAFLPAALVGALAHGVIKSVLFSPWVVSASLIAGGVAILAIERLAGPARHHDVDSFSTSLSLKIGLFQCVAMIPGVSRSGATIMGSLLMGVDRKAATEFSFFLAIPTMMAATAYDLYKNWASLSLDNGAVIAVGFLTAFLSALAVVRVLVAFISRHGFAPFAFYRIALGTAMLAILAV